MKNHNIPDKALILAAGFGTRLRPHTNDKPKPMVEVNGRSLIWRTLDKLRAAGISYVVVNAHYNAELLAQHMADYMAQHDGITIQVSLEDEILDTEDLYDAIYGGVDLFVDAGYCPLEPTTLLDLTKDQPQVLRMGQGVIDF